MPYVLELCGQTVVLDDRDVRTAMDRLVRFSRIQVWAGIGGPNSQFQHYYDRWRYHNRAHSVNLFLLVAETLGGATIPDESWANRLRRRQQQIGRMIRPNTIDRFFREVVIFNRNQARFVRAMKRYLNRVEGGSETTVTILELTRDGSFLVLSACAALLSGGASSGQAVAAATSVSRTLVQAAARQFVVTQLQNSATRLGRSMSGERVTARETVADITTTAITSVRDAMLGEIVGKFMAPLTGSLARYAERAVSRGQILRGVGAEIGRGQIEGVIPDAITRFVQRNPRTVRRLLEQCINARDSRAIADQFAQGMMTDRAFQQDLESRLQAVM